MEFKVNQISSNQISRAGTLSTNHGEVSTPAFLPVATQASVKSLSSHEIVQLGAEMLLSNAYHLYLRPGLEIIQHAGGLHEFMSWNAPILTDSGGFQIYSLGKLMRVSENGVQFKSHIDGSFHFLWVDDASNSEDHGILRIFPETGISHFQQIRHCFLEDLLWNAEGDFRNVAGIDHGSDGVDHVSWTLDMTTTHHDHNAFASQNFFNPFRVFIVT